MTQYNKLKFNQRVTSVGDPMDDHLNYSFGGEVYSDFVIRSNKIKEALGLEKDFPMQMEVSVNDSENKKYNIETIISGESTISKDLHLVVNFLYDITNNPINIINSEDYRSNFLESASILKSQKIKLKDVMVVLNEFKKKYELSEYMVCNPDEPSLTYHGWNSDSGILIPYEHKMDLKEGIGDVALRLHESKLLDIDHKKITDIKEKHRSSFFKNKDLVIKKDLAYFRNIVKQGKKMDNPLFLITESSSFEDVINTINKEEIITYFPFSSRLDNEFLLRVLDYSA